MKCPFCSNRLSIWKAALHTTYGCMMAGCEVGGMTRYQVTYLNYPTRLLSKTFMLDKFYIQINYDSKKTVISILEACFLLESIEVNRAMEIDFSRSEELVDKIKMLYLFS